MPSARYQCSVWAWCWETAGRHRQTKSWFEGKAARGEKSSSAVVLGWRDPGFTLGETCPISHQHLRTMVKACAGVLRRDKYGRKPEESCMYSSNTHQLPCSSAQCQGAGLILRALVPHHCIEGPVRVLVAAFSCLQHTATAGSSTPQSQGSPARAADGHHGDLPTCPGLRVPTAFGVPRQPSHWPCTCHATPAPPRSISLS